MSDFTFEFYDAFEFAELVAAAPQIVEAEITTATDRVAIYGMGVSIRNTPVDTGHLRRSHAQMPTSYSGGTATGGWGNAVAYGVFQEYGTRFMKAQPFMEPGREAAESRMDAEFSGAITRIVEALGG